MQFIQNWRHELFSRAESERRDNRQIDIYTHIGVCAFRDKIEKCFNLDLIADCCLSSVKVQRHNYMHIDVGQKMLTYFNGMRAMCDGTGTWDLSVQCIFCGSCLHRSDNWIYMRNSVECRIKASERSCVHCKYSWVMRKTQCCMGKLYICKPKKQNPWLIITWSSFCSFLVSRICLYLYTTLLAKL